MIVKYVILILFWYIIAVESEKTIWRTFNVNDINCIQHNHKCLMKMYRPGEETNNYYGYRTHAAVQANDSDGGHDHKKYDGTNNARQQKGQHAEDCNPKLGNEDGFDDEYHGCEEGEWSDDEDDSYLTASEDVPMKEGICVRQVIIFLNRM